VLDFLKLTGTRACPRVCGYPWIAVTGVVSCPWRVADSGAGTDFSTRIRIYKVPVAIYTLPLWVSMDPSDLRYFAMDDGFLVLPLPLFIRVRAGLWGTKACRLDPPVRAKAEPRHRQQAGSPTCRPSRPPAGRRAG
jgi:hypothetical protein